MREPVKKEFKLILLGENLPELKLKDVIIYCSNMTELQIILHKHRSANVSLVCSGDMAIDVALLLNYNPNVKTVYVRTNPMDIVGPNEFVNKNIQCIRLTNDEKELIRYLYVKAMLCYSEQGEEYRNNGENGLSNQCFLGAREAFEQMKLLH